MRRPRVNLSIGDLRFTPRLLSKPVARGLAVETTLQHFVMVTYWVDPDCLRKHLHPRFEPICLSADGRHRQSFVSVVTFLDRDFRFVMCPSVTWNFGQTNYRAYVQDTQTGEQAAWFFGTCLDSLAVVVPRALWKLPWHRGRMAFRTRYDEHTQRYSTFSVTTRSRWAPGHLELKDSGRPLSQLPGVPNLEAGLVLFTHPMRGYFFRQDGGLGSYAIWHDRMRPTVGELELARYPLLDRLGLVAEGDLASVHSVLIQPSVDFTIYLPPSKIGSSSI